LTHTSGLTWGIQPADETLDQQVKRVAQLPLLFQPGASWNYGSSFDVVGRLVEVVSGQSFDRFLQERIFGPLEMVDTGFFVPGRSANRLATWYTRAENGKLGRDTSAGQDLSQPSPNRSPSGGLVSTAADYARFGQMLLNGGVLGTTRLLGRKTVELMMADHLSQMPNPLSRQFPGQDGFGMALGGSTVVDAALTGLPASAGSYSWPGAFTTGFWIDPREQLLGLLLVQLTPSNFRLIDIFQVLTYQALVN
jgi:CubicO group peptidase (beta-lactamase class C family)